MAARLAEYRRGRTWGEVAQAIQQYVPGTSRGTLRNYEVEERAPDLVVLWGLCQVYRVPFGEAAEALARELNGLPADAPTPSLTPDEVELLELYAQLLPEEERQMAKRFCRDLLRVRQAALAVADEQETDP